MPSASSLSCRRLNLSRYGHNRIVPRTLKNMILCVTLNPCLDKTLTVPAWRPGELLRGRAVREVVGGKGNNVARALARLGREPRPVTFFGGPVGAYCESLAARAATVSSRSWCAPRRPLARS